MSKKIRGDIIAHVPDYSKETYGDYNEWNKVSLRLFGKKTPNVQEPLIGDWGLSEPVIKNIRVKANEKNKYKVKADIYFRNYDDGFDAYSYDEKKGHFAMWIDSDSMIISVHRKRQKEGEGYGEYAVIDTNKYSVRIHDKLDMYESGYFNMTVKNNKLKLKWLRGDYKYLKGTWKRKNWKKYPKSWAYKY